MNPIKPTTNTPTAPHLSPSFNFSAPAFETVLAGALPRLVPVLALVPFAAPVMVAPELDTEVLNVDELVVT